MAKTAVEDRTLVMPGTSSSMTLEAAQAVISRSHTVTRSTMGQRKSLLREHACPPIR